MGAIFAWFTTERGVRIVASILLATLLWLSVKMVKPYRTEVDVPVRYTGIPGNFKLVKPLPDKLTVIVYGLGHQLILPSQRWLRDTLQVDLSKSLGTKRLETRTWMPELTKYLPAALTVEDVKPDTVGLRFEDKIYKRVPVVSSLQLTYQKGYSLLRPIIFQPDSVMLQATSTELKDVSSWPTQELRIDAIVDTQIVQVPMGANPNILVEPALVLAEIDVARFTEKRHRAKLVVINLPVGVRLRLLPEVVDVVYQVPFDRYYEVDPDDITVVVDYQDMAEGATLVFPRITKQPAFIKAVQVVPQSIAFVRGVQ
jgi:hypothetical protein